MHWPAYLIEKGRNLRCTLEDVVCLHFANLGKSGGQSTINCTLFAFERDRTNGPKQLAVHYAVYMYVCRHARGYSAISVQRLRAVCYDGARGRRGETSEHAMDDVAEQKICVVRRDQQRAES